jgi:hypothetical protein
VADFAFTILAGFVGVFVVALAVAPANDPALLLVTSLLGHSAGQLLGLWVVLRRRRWSFGAIGLHVEPSDGLYLFVGVLLQIVIAAAFIPVADWIGAEGSSQALTVQIPNVSGAALRLGLVVSVALVGPVTEELMFRGLLPRVLDRWMGRGLSYVVAALVFAFFHLLGVTGIHFRQVILVFVPQLFVVGLILGWQAMRRRRLGVAIFIHSGFNLTALALLFTPETLR